MAADIQTPRPQTGEEAHDDPRWYNAMYGTHNSVSPDSADVEMPASFVGPRASNINMRHSSEKVRYPPQPTSIIAPEAELCTMCGILCMLNRWAGLPLLALACHALGIPINCQHEGQMLGRICRTCKLNITRLQQNVESSAQSTKGLVANVGSGMRLIKSASERDGHSTSTFTPAEAIRKSASERWVPPCWRIVLQCHTTSI